MYGLGGLPLLRPTPFASLACTRNLRGCPTLVVRLPSEPLFDVLIGYTAVLAALAGPAEAAQATGMLPTWPAVPNSVAVIFWGGGEPTKFCRACATHARISWGVLHSTGECRYTHVHIAQQFAHCRDLLGIIHIWPACNSTIRPVSLMLCTHALLLLAFV